ncbi:MAG TPA: chemotaxis protein CheC [Opitutus sp.]|nr:chemotaxis protein CheC [Opitutus sp.]
MELTVHQQDALTELINIGYGRAAGSLSELTGYRITLEVPQVSMHELSAIAPMLQNVIQQDVASVKQLFSGPVAGDALLILDQNAALALSRLLTDDRSGLQELDLSAREIITEVGNILLNACLGVFGNLLKIHISFAVPQLQLGSVSGVLADVASGPLEAVRYGLMIHTRFYVRAGNVAGYLVIILGIASLDRLLQELENWEKRQVE